MNTTTTVKVLFCCMGNICRSPSAEAIFTKLVGQAGLAERIDIDSAGTHSYHVGDPPDLRAQQAGLRHGYDLSPLRARKIRVDDFSRFNYVVAMDHSNIDYLERLVGNRSIDNLTLMMDWAQPTATQIEVPDPYYGGEQGFTHVIHMLESACAGLLTHIRQQHQL